MKTDALSKSELEVMVALWRIGSGSVSDIRRELAAERDLAYTTVATLLGRMAEKGAVTAKKVGRSFVFEPTEQQSDYRKSRLSDLVRQFFDDRPSSLASHFIQTNSFTQDELDDLRRLIEQKRRR